MRKLLILSGLVLWLVLASCATTDEAPNLRPVTARPEYLVINEVSSAGDYQFIELYNLHSQPIRLAAGWRVDDSGDEFDRGSRPFIIPEGTVVPAHGYLLIVPFMEEHAAEVLNNPLIPEEALCDISFYLGSRDTVSLYYHALLVDRCRWNIPANTYGRVTDGAGERTLLLRPTPLSANRRERGSPRPSDLVINEAASRPVEYVELYNRGKRDVLLEPGRWYLEDAGRKRTIDLSFLTVIEPGEAVAVYTNEGEHYLELNDAGILFLRHDETVMDFLIWSEPLTVRGRVPDGGDSWMDIDPSPGRLQGDSP